MARAKNCVCPKCGCEVIRKEKMLGVQTGDLVCSDCGYTSTHNEFEEAYRQNHPEDDG